MFLEAGVLVATSCILISDLLESDITTYRWICYLAGVHLSCFARPSVVIESVVAVVTVVAILTVAVSVTQYS